MKQREIIAQSVEVAIKPLDKLLSQFQQYKELLYLDVDKWGQTIKFRAELYLKQ